MSETQRIMAEAQARAQAETETVRDETGRTLEVRRTTSREARKFMRACGAATDIDRWFGTAMVAIQVRSIDGVPVRMPLNPDQADELVEKLGDAGLVAVVEWGRRTLEQAGEVRLAQAGE